MNLKNSRLWSPATAAVLLLFGLVFGVAISHLAGAQWPSVATRIYYLGLFIWGVLLLIQKRDRIHAPSLIDVLFLIFLLWLLVSIVTHDEERVSVSYYAKFLPFLVLLPYCLGRLMEKEDFSTFRSLLPWLATFLLLLCVLDFWRLPNNETTHSLRWIFFGINHSPLLIAIVVSLALLSLSNCLVAPDRLHPPLLQVVMWGALGGFTVALVMIAARGVLIACAVALLLMVLLARDAPWPRRLLIAAYFFALIAAAFFMLPKPQSELYARARVATEQRLAINQSIAGQIEILSPSGDALDTRCGPLREGVNSIAIRGVLYLEAISLAQQYPLMGVGAARFGDYSCAGSGAYPHSTVLQAFAELGILGGTALLMLFIASLSSVMHAYRNTSIQLNETIFWIALLSFFAQLDQIYGNYFMAAASFFLFGVANQLRIRSRSLDVQSFYA